MSWTSAPYTCVDCFQREGEAHGGDSASAPYTCVDCFGKNAQMRERDRSNCPKATYTNARLHIKSSPLTLPSCVGKDVRYAHSAVRTPTGKHGYLLFAHAMVGTDLPPQLFAYFL